MCQRSLETGGVPVVRSTVPEPPRPAYVAHPTALVDAGSQVGEGTRVWHFAHVNSGATIGRGCSLGQNVFVASGVTIGDNVKIQNNVSVYEGVTLEDDVFCGPSMVFTNVVNPRSHVSRKHEYKQTLVRRGATIGANATIVCGHNVGAYAFIAAGAVVTRDVPDHALVMGAPGRVVGWMCRCGVRLPMGAGAGVEEAACDACGESYRRVDSRVVSSVAEPV
jgi:UDP-2-acetamido-3-amino-2,3-dideoxy-glucuronate N-acetyltransferase